MVDAIVSDENQVTRQEAAQMNCPLTDEDLISCLRNKEVQELLNVQVSTNNQSIKKSFNTIPTQTYFLY